jgi:hypothetical protein
MSPQRKLEEYITFLHSVGVLNYATTQQGTVRYHSGGSMKLNACILHLVYMVYL